MKEYISREAAKERFKCIAIVGTDYIMQRLDDVPAADVVEVVRCKDCNNSAEVACGVMHCCYFNKNVEEDDYCSNGC